MAILLSLSEDYLGFRHSIGHFLNRILQILLQSSSTPKISDRCVGDLGIFNSFSLTCLAVPPCETLAAGAGALLSLPSKHEVFSGFTWLSRTTRCRKEIHWGRTPALRFSSPPCPSPPSNHDACLLLVIIHILARLGRVIRPGTASYNLDPGTRRRHGRKLVRAGDWSC